MVSSDSTITLERHTRKITLADGPVIAANKSKLHKKQVFQVTELVTEWYGDTDPAHVVAYGFYTSKHGLTVRCKRVYDYGNMPKWMREAVNG